jgi:hypothetical protein
LGKWLFLLKKEVGRNGSQYRSGYGWRREDGSVATVDPEICCYCRTGRRKNNKQALLRAKCAREPSEDFSLYRVFLNSFGV